MIPQADNRMMTQPPCPRCVGMKQGTCPHCGRIAGRHVYFDIVVPREEPHAIDGSALRPRVRARVSRKRR